jgi:hypothetical protein
MLLLDKILGRPLASSEQAKEGLSVATGCRGWGWMHWPRRGYGPEAALTILLPLGALGLRYMPIILVTVVELSTLYLWYRQTAASPNGGGAYIVWWCIGCASRATGFGSN